MKAKLKLVLFMSVLSLTAIACGSGAARPFSGLDVSRLPVGLPALQSETADKTPDKQGARATEGINNAEAVQNSQPVIIY